MSESVCRCWCGRRGKHLSEDKTWYCYDHIPSPASGGEKVVIEVGDVVQLTLERRSKGQYLVSGTGLYDEAIVGSVAPFVVVSKAGDMLWSKTVKPEQFDVVGKASESVMRVVMRRLENDGYSLPAPTPSPSERSTTGETGQGASGAITKTTEEQRTKLLEYLEQEVLENEYSQIGHALVDELEE